MQIESVLGYTIVGTTIVTLFGILARKAIISFFTDRSEIRQLDTRDKINSNHLDEILRLEALVRKLSKRVGELETLVHDCMDLEIQDAADIAELTILIEGNCMAACPHNNHERMQKALERIRSRRADRANRKKATADL